MWIQIDKNSELPVYRQIMEQIANKIQKKELFPGDQLPTERELSISSGISRGTIKRAYDELSSDGIIERLQGSGTFVANIENAAHLSRKDIALELIDKMLDDLSKKNLSYNEMKSIINSKIRFRRSQESNVHIALIDCNMETLNLIGEQLKTIPNVDVSELILSHLEKNPQKLSFDYDLILTTNTHYLQVIKLSPVIYEKVIKVMIIPSQKVQYNLSKIHNNCHIGIWCVSQEFANIIYTRIVNLGKNDINIEYHLDSEPGLFSTFTEDKDVLILPADYLGYGNENDVSVINEFQAKGGMVIFFDYLIDRGSMLHIQHEAELRWLAKQKIPSSYS